MIAYRSMLLFPRLDLIGWSYLVFLAVYAGILLLNPHMDMVGYEQLREQIMGWDDVLPVAIFPEIGRFYPLFSAEYRLLGLFSPSIFAMYVFNLIQFLGFAALLYYLLRQAGAQPGLAYLISIGLFLMPAFTNVWMGFAATERNVIFLLAGLLVCHTRYQEQPRPVLFIIGLVCANLALYYKETVFLAVAVYAGTHLMLTWRSAAPSARRFDVLLILGAFVFLAVYLIVIFPRMGDVLYGAYTSPAVVMLIRNTANYTFNDPHIVLLHVPLTLWRLYEVFWRRQPATPIYDAMLFAGAIYFLVYLKLNLYATNYLLPVYVFSLPAAVYYLARQGLVKNKVWRWFAAIAGFFAITSAIPFGAHILSLQKLIPVNTVRTMDALAQDIRERRATTRPSIFLDGVHRDISYHSSDFTYDRDAYFNIGESLKRRGLNTDQFDLKSDIPPKNLHLFQRGSNASYPYSVFRSEQSWEPVTGDYLVLNPMNTKNLTQEYLKSLDDRYELVFQTNSRLAIPDLSLRAFVKFVLQNWFSRDWVNDANLSRRPDYRIFIRK